MLGHIAGVIGDRVKPPLTPDSKAYPPNSIGITDLCKHEIMAITCVLCSPRWSGFEWDVARQGTHCSKCAGWITVGTRVHRKWGARFWIGECCEVTA